MSKVKDAEIIKPTTDEKIKEAIKSLQVQYDEHKKYADHHSTMATKALGALEAFQQVQSQQENK